MSPPVLELSSYPVWEVYGRRSTSSTCEPSIANRAGDLILTGNHFVAVSHDHGRSWRFLDTKDEFDILGPKDQSVIFEPARGLMIWVVLGTERNRREGRVLKLLVSSSDLDSWAVIDISPHRIHSDWGNFRFDYPQLSLSSDHLFLTCRMEGGGAEASVVLRVPLDGLGSDTPVVDWYQVPDDLFLRCARGADDTMYIAAILPPAEHPVNLHRLAVWRWPDSDAEPTRREIEVSGWSEWHAADEIGSRWYLRNRRNDRGLNGPYGRILAGWVEEGGCGFMWTSAPMVGRPFPFLRAVRLTDADGLLSVMDEPDIWSDSGAYAYPDVCPNDAGDLGLTAHYAAEGSAPTIVVGTALDHSAEQFWDIRHRPPPLSTTYPSHARWGDFISCRRHDPDGQTWLAAGQALRGGGSRQHVMPYVVRFGRGGSGPLAMEEED